MTGRWRVRPADRPAGRQVSAKLTDEGSFVSCPARRQCPPNTTAALAATYPLRRFAPQWARFDNRQKRPAHQPLPSLLSAAAAQAVQAIPRTDNVPRRTNSARSAPPILHNPQRAKGSLNRRFEWFSLVTFFLQKKKVTRAGARNAPACARRRNTCTFPRQGILKP